MDRNFLSLRATPKRVIIIIIVVVVVVIIIIIITIIIIIIIIVIIIIVIIITVIIIRNGKRTLWSLIRSVIIRKHKKSKDYYKADLKQCILFFITIFRVAIPAFFRSVTSVNLKKAGMASRNIVIKDSSLWTSCVFVRYILADLISFLEIQRLQLAGSSSTVFAANLILVIIRAIKKNRTITQR